MTPGALLSADEYEANQADDSDASLMFNYTADVPQSALLNRNVRSMPLLLEGARGNWLRVSNGVKGWYIFDGSGGASVSNIGHGDERVLEAQITQCRTTGVSYAASVTFWTQIAEDFANFLLKSTNYKMAKVVFYGSGSEGVEASMKLGIQYHAKEKPNPEPKRTMYIARERSYHGATIGALGVSGHKSRREIYESVLPKNIHFISPCNPYRDMEEGMTNDQYVQRLAQELEDKIVKLGAENVAGFFAEPVVGAALGCVPAVRGYLKAMKKVCVTYGVLFILDEVMCGMGRTGNLHAWQEEDVVPDIQIVGKGLAGGYAEISAVLIGHKVIHDFLYGPGNGAFSHGHTFQNFPMACAAGLAVQKIVQEENLLENVRQKGTILQHMLKKRLKDHPYVGDVRGKGLFQGIEFVQDKASKESFDPERNIAWRLHERGLTPECGIYVYPGSGTVDGVKGDHIIVSPAYNITDADLNTVVDRVVHLIEDFFKDGMPSGPQSTRRLPTVDIC